MSKLCCKIFGHEFRRVIGCSEWSLFGTEYEFDRCLRCQTSNPRWVAGPNVLTRKDGWKAQKLEAGRG